MLCSSVISFREPMRDPSYLQRIIFYFIMNILLLLVHFVQCTPGTYANPIRVVAS